jgi:hypothetical protein
MLCRRVLARALRDRGMARGRRRGCTSARSPTPPQPAPALRTVRAFPDAAPRTCWLLGAPPHLHDRAWTYERCTQRDNGMSGPQLMTGSQRIQRSWRAAVGAGLAATLGWVAAGTSNAHADADVAEVISNWSNTHQCKPQVRCCPHLHELSRGRERTLHACTPLCLLAGAVCVERVDTRVRLYQRALGFGGRWMGPPLLQLARSQCTARLSLTTCVAVKASAVWSLRLALSPIERTAPRLHREWLRLWMTHACMAVWCDGGSDW